MSPYTRSALCTLLMVATALSAHFLRPDFSTVRSERIGLDSRIPTAFAQWVEDASITPIAPDPELQAGVERLYAEVLGRTYVNSLGQRVMLSIAYGGQRPRALQVHRPEGCYSSQGFSISQKGWDFIEVGNRTINVMTLLAKRDRRIEPVTYWIRLGDGVVAGWLMQTGTRMRYGVRREIPDELLFRVSTVGEDSSAGLAIQREFIHALLDSLDRDTRTLLVGDQAGHSGT